MQSNRHRQHSSSRLVTAVSVLPDRGVLGRHGRRCARTSTFPGIIHRFISGSLLSFLQAQERRQQHGEADETEGDPAPT